MLWRMPADLSPGRIGIMFAHLHQLPAFPGPYTVRKNSRSPEAVHAQCYFTPALNGALLNRTTGSSMVAANDSQVTWRNAMARLTSTADLRRVISEPRAATRAKILDALDEQSIDFLKRCPFALVGTTAADGTIEVSPKGDEPGFIRVEDPKTLLIPERIGNNLAFGLSNILATGKIGLIGLVPATGETLRVSGTAEIFDDPDLVASLSSLGKPALLATRVHIQHCYFHCARSVVRAKLWDPTAWPAPGRVSFGKIIAPRVGAGPEVAAQIDAGVEGAYTTRLWTNS
jgi:PPOX class probable FMN-dependent enzyme